MPASSVIALEALAADADLTFMNLQGWQIYYSFKLKVLEVEAGDG